MNEEQANLTLDEGQDGVRGRDHPVAKQDNGVAHAQPKISSEV